MTRWTFLLTAFFTLFLPLFADANWVWTRTNCGYVYKWVPATPVSHHATTTASTTNNDNSVTYTYNISYDQPVASQGATLWGAAVYANTDLGAMYHQASRFSSDALSVAAAANAGATDIGNNIARVAEIQAQGQAAAAALLATRPVPQSTVSKQINFGVQAGVSTGNPATPANPAALDLRTVVNAKCSACHNPANKQGGLDLSDLSNVDSDKILDRITSHDPLKRMPKGNEGTPGIPLTLEEKKAFFNAVRN